MPFVVTSEREASEVRYEKVGRLRPCDDGMIEAIRDGYGVIGSFLPGDFILALVGLPIPGLEISESGKIVEITGCDGRGYFVLARQVRGMIQNWPKGKAAMFVGDKI